ncbi:mechanosensitive ion channel family protein [Butyrivibrio sp. VCD2006]|uniref:mechanosensitive ion channel family protein n=1 Tax=Butyrivibrio sp. VCD2006 TaxID=1280664 RepID=UPI0004250453|nr:mechanosensitive ion channel family protein [Butyrivibrio sp. VCD2006]
MLLNFFIELLPDTMETQFIGLDAPQKVVVFCVIVFLFIVFLTLYVGISIMIMKIVNRIFRHLKKRKGNSITIQFLQKTITLVVIVVFVVLPLGGQKLAASLLGSTAVVAAVVGLAANDVIKDMFAGLEISIYKPFDLGSRIMLEDGRSGIVEDLNLRHVVLMLVDTTRLVVPNSKANSMLITNYSYADEVPRSFDVKYAVSYKADIEKTKELIRKTICDCELTLNEDKYDAENPLSRSVYLIEITDSALVMMATVYYAHGIRTEVVKDEVNTKVFEALTENGIEMTYDCMNVIMREDL